MIRFTDVTKSYGPGTAPALRDINLEIQDGEFVFIVGASGSGKSTMIKLLTKELDATSGTIYVNGRYLNKIKRKHIPKYRKRIGCVFQDFRLLSDRTVYDNIAFAERVTGASTRTIRRTVPKMLSRVGLAGKYRSKPDELSGGEQQRVAIARALINNPDLILADEPTGNLDAKNAWEIMRLLEKINESGTTVVVVTHNLDFVRDLKKRTLWLEKGEIIRDEPAGE